jgi:hypothetical protein
MLWHCWLGDFWTPYTSQDLARNFLSDQLWAPPLHVAHPLDPSGNKAKLTQM